MKRLLSVLVAASLLAVTLFMSASLGHSTSIVALDSVTAVSDVASPTPALEDEVSSPAPDSPVIDAAIQSHQELYADRWGIQRIGAPEVWQAASFAPTIVAVLDTGIATDTQFNERIVGAVDFTASGTTDDEHGHGTHMADTIAAVAPNALILNVKVADHRGRCDSTTVAQGIRWAADRGAQVINVSLDVADSAQLRNAVDYAWAKGALVVAAAGNSGTTVPAYPAAYVNTIAVAGTNSEDGFAVLSNHGDWIDIAAPGHRIVAQSHEGEPAYETGTSPAAAHVSGVAALLFGKVSDEPSDGHSNQAVRDALLTSAEHLPLTGTGSGLVDARSAISALGE